MIKKEVVSQIVGEWLEDKDYFLVEISISPSNRIVVEIDHAEGVWIDDCVNLSKYIESKLNRDEEDYELEVGSAGIGQSFKVLQQYYNHIDKEVEVGTKKGQKLRGILKDVDEDKIILSTTVKSKSKGTKPVEEKEDLTLTYDQINYTKYLISFK
ncbi:MAG: ribosome assembly cofactor RimP [Bacteroidales bacterium]|nr:ribosome assembly cofactor RimP [Bacteroidales bacterium]